MVKRLVLVLLAATLLTLGMSAVALAWTPQEIYDDYADNGKLDRDYSCKELKEAVGDASIDQYGNQTIVDDLKLIFEKQCRDEFPYTGFQIAIAVIVALLLIGGGIALRFFTRRHRPQNS